MRRTVRLTFEVLGAVLAGAAILFAFLTWRLTQEGPIHLRFLSGYVEQALARADQPYLISIEDTVLTWAGWDRNLDVRAINLRVRDRDGRELATLPEVSFTFSARAMLKGLVAPSKIEIIGPRLTLVRNADGSIAFGPGGILAPEAVTAGGDGSFEALFLFANDMLGPPDYNRPTGYLTSAAILNGSVQMIDHVTGLTWQAEGFGAEARRDVDGLVGDMFAALPQLGDPAILSASLSYNRDTRVLRLESSVGALQLSALGLIEPALSELSTVDLAVSAKVTTAITVSEDHVGDVGVIDFSLSGGAGELDLPRWFKEPLPIMSLAAEGRLDRRSDIMLSSLNIDLGGPRIEANAQWQGAFTGQAWDGGAPLLAADLQVTKLPADRLDPFWPEEVAADTRAWVVPNIPAGMVEEASADLLMRLPIGGSGIALQSVSGTLSTTGLTVHYLRPMPPIENGVATAEFDAKTFRATISGGAVGNVKVTKGALEITGLDVEDQFIKVGGDLEAPLSDALVLLDHPRLGYAAKLGIDPKTTAGDAKASILFDFPAAKNLAFDDVKLKVDARLEKVAIRKMRFDQDVTDGTLDISLDESGMNITGPIVFAGAPLQLDWTQTFTDSAAFDERLHAVGTIDADQLALLGFDYRTWVTGQCMCDFLYTTFADGKARLEGKLDLAQARLELPAAKWWKDPGAAARAELVLDIAGDRPVAIPSFEVATDDLAARGALTFDAAGNVSRVTLPDLRMGGSQLAGVDVELRDGWTLATVDDGYLDASPWMEDDDPLTPEELALTEPERQRPFTLRGKLSGLSLGEGQELTGVTIEAVREPQWWDLVAFQATLPSGEPITFDYRPGDPGEHALSITTSDGGGALRALGLYDSVEGGTLSITGKVKDNQPWRPLRGRIEMSSFRLVNTPFIARFLSVATLTGVVDAVTGEGFLFGGASGRFVKTRGLIDVRRFRSAGPSIGVTAQGKIDLDRNLVNVKGTLVPAYALNSVFGNIPLIGPLLQGGEGEGMFAATYSIEGGLNEPRINVNEWSALAPGFIRDWFTDDGTELPDEFDGDDGGQATQPQTPSGKSTPTGKRRDE
ncbi:uncharacterized protein DUF3971 [Dongia mobilis]|uniref:Uncharacterized protein DUF3971 n=1 Tax=Dongia mobilis TaxID=578943 RepID=A0A4V3DE23_9PROT|nr:AsmA-like C-terminal domain-containing protein [Dongia mobilis]TDQ78915.1 uncharacterized protein DUF3971 [Dongia mobilis]